MIGHKKTVQAVIFNIYIITNKNVTKNMCVVINVLLNIYYNLLSFKRDCVKRRVGFSRRETSKCTCHVHRRSHVTSQSALLKGWPSTPAQVLFALPPLVSDSLWSISAYHHALIVRDPHRSRCRLWMNERGADDTPPTCNWNTCLRTQMLRSRQK